MQLVRMDWRGAAMGESSMAGKKYFVSLCGVAKTIEASIKNCKGARSPLPQVRVLRREAVGQGIKPWPPSIFGGGRVIFGRGSEERAGIVQRVEVIVACGPTTIDGIAL